MRLAPGDKFLVGSIARERVEVARERIVMRTEESPELPQEGGRALAVAEEGGRPSASS